MVIVTGVSNRSVGHLSVPHRSPVETIPEPSSVLNNKGVIFCYKMCYSSHLLSPSWHTGGKETTDIVIDSRPKSDIW